MSIASQFVFVADRVDPAELGDAPTTTAEAELVFAALERTLRDAGLAFRDVVKTRLFYAFRSDYPEMNQVRGPLFRSRFADGGFPAATGVITGGRDGARPQFELEVIAHANRRAFNAPGVIQEWNGVRPPFSHAVIAGDVLFVSGQGAFDDKGELAAPDPIGQTIATLPVLTKILEAAGCDRGDILSLTAYLTPPAQVHVDQVAAEIETYLRDNGRGEPPIVTIISVNELAFPGMEVEIELCARAPQDDRSASTRTATAGPAKATRHKSFLYGRSEVRQGSDPESCFDRSWSALREALGGLDARPSDIRMMTVWFSPMRDRARLEAIAKQALAPGVGLTLAPMPDDGPCTIILEAFGHAG
jgi:enamine deaminase RidA (YjgF/YER057c/UK114 family)